MVLDDVCEAERSDEEKQNMKALIYLLYFIEKIF